MNEMKSFWVGQNVIYKPTSSMVIIKYIDQDGTARIYNRVSKSEKVVRQEDLEPLIEETPSTAKVYLCFNEKDTYLGEQRCLWNISTNCQEATKIVLEVNRWTYTVVRSKTASRKLTVTNKNMLNLEIIGFEHDNRCRWCRTFRTGLKTTLKRKTGSEDSCILQETCELE